MEKWFKEKSPEILSEQEKAVRYYKDLKHPENTDPVDILRTIKKERIAKEDLETEIHEKVNEVVEDILLKSEIVGQGNDGIVFRVRIEDLSPDEIHLMEDDGINFSEQDRALKLMKIYRPLDGEKEFLIQKKAYEILSSHEGVASVPSPFALRDQKIEPGTKEYLNSKGASISEEMETLIMDYIEGKDLDEIFYDFVLREEGYEDDYIEAMTFAQKHSVIANSLGFLMPEADPRYDRTAEVNTEKLMSYLKKKGYEFPKNIFDQIEGAMSLLRENKVFHNDLHGRNIRIDTAGRAFILDFGRSSTESPTRHNTYFLESWKKLLPDSERGEEAPREVVELENLRQKFSLNSAWQERVEFLRQSCDVQALRKRWHLVVNDELKLQTFLTELKEVASSDKANSEVIKDFLKNESEKSSSVYIQNKIGRLLSNNYFQ